MLAVSFLSYLVPFSIVVGFLGVFLAGIFGLFSFVENSYHGATEFFGFFLILVWVVLCCSFGLWYVNGPGACQNLQGGGNNCHVWQAVP